MANYDILDISNLILFSVILLDSFSDSESKKCVFS